MDFLQLWRLESPRSRCWQIQYLVTGYIFSLWGHKHWSLLHQSFQKSNLPLEFSIILIKKFLLLQLILSWGVWPLQLKSLADLQQFKSQPQDYPCILGLNGPKRIGNIPIKESTLGSLKQSCSFVHPFIHFTHILHVPGIILVAKTLWMHWSYATSASN